MLPPFNMIRLFFMFLVYIISKVSHKNKVAKREQQYQYSV